VPYCEIFPCAAFALAALMACPHLLRGPRLKVVALKSPLCRVPLD